MVAPSSGATNPDQLTVGSSQLFFSATTSAAGRELWSTAGTAATTAMVANIATGSASSNPQFLEISNGTLFFAANGPNGTQLWESGGTTASTNVVANTGTGVVSLFPSQLTDVSGLLYFTANDGTHGRELWTSDGTTMDTTMLLDINTTSTALEHGADLEQSAIAANDVDRRKPQQQFRHAGVGSPGHGRRWQSDLGSGLGALQGVAVTQVDNTNGTWQYTTNGGSSWTAFPAVTETAALLLSANSSTSIRFVPNANFSGDVPGGITLRAWDQTSGTSGSTANTTANGGSTAFSSAIVTASIRVTPSTGSSPPWQNPTNADDVNNDGSITPLDALAIINELNKVGEHVLPAPTAGNQPPPYYDVNGDGSVTPIDALDVINYLNAHTALASPTVAAPTVGSAVVGAAVTTGVSTNSNATTAGIALPAVAFGVSSSTSAAPANCGVGASTSPAGQNPSRAAAADRVFASYAASTAQAGTGSSDLFGAFDALPTAAHRTGRPMDNAADWGG